MTTRTRATMRLSIAVMLSVAALAAGGCTSDFKPPIVPTPPSDPPPLSPTFTLSGVVTEMTAAGVEPVEGALVTELRSRRDVRTDGDGRYRIPGLSAGSFSIQTEKPGYTTLTSPVAIAEDAQVEIRLTRIVSFILSGVVFETTPTGRQPVEGIELYCDSCGSPVGHTFTASDAQGRYSFEWSMNGRHRLLVWRDGYALVHPDGNYTSGSEYINATVDGDTQFDIEVMRH